jgi:hypothetical protein
MEPQVLAIGVKGCALQAGPLAGLKPELAGLGNCNACAVGGMNAGSDFNVGGRLEIVGGLLLGEGLQAPLARLVDVVDDPRLLLDAPRCCPSSLAN